MTLLCTIYEDEKLKAGVFGGLKIIDTNLILFPILVPQICIKGCHNRICGIRIMKTSKRALKKAATIQKCSIRMIKNSILFPIHLP